MTAFVAVPGAFRGAWYFQRLAAALAARGDRLVGVDLVGTDLDAWVASVASAFDANDLERAVVVGHSMGGVVAQASTGALGDRCERLVLLDSPLVEAGQRAVDVSSEHPPPDDALPPRDALIPASDVGAAQGFEDPDLAAWVNERLSSVPMGPQLDPVPADAARPDATTIVFFARTPEGYPSTFARRRCEREAIPHVVLDAHHDAPILDPALVARALRSGAPRSGAPPSGEEPDQA